MPPSLSYLVLPVVAVVTMVGCGSTHRLHEYDFAETRVAVIANMPPRPLIFTDVLSNARIDPDDWLGTIFRAGSSIVKHSEVRQAQHRMDSALAYVDVAELVARQALQESVPTLGYHPVNTPTLADVILDIRITDYGLVADSWEADVHFELDAAMLLINRHTRQVVVFYRSVVVYL